MPDRHLRARRERVVEIVGSERPHRQQRDLREAPADLRRLGAGRHRQPRRAARQRRRRRSRRRRDRSRRP